MLFWIFGYGIKPRPALDEAARVVGVEASQVTARSIEDLAPNAVERLHARWATRPFATLRFGAPSLAHATGGVVIRCRDHGVRARQIVLEDHGLSGLMFMGRDAITLRTLPEHAGAWRQLREVLTPDAEIILLHCLVAADGGELCKAISALVGCPIIAGDQLQVTHNQAFEGTAYRITATSVEPGVSLSKAVLHFD
jgi:hypothetical protein